jgi:hypothetical protein
MTNLQSDWQQDYPKLVKNVGVSNIKIIFHGIQREEAAPF